MTKPLSKQYQKCRQYCKEMHQQNNKLLLWDKCSLSLALIVPLTFNSCLNMFWQNRVQIPQRVIVMWKVHLKICGLMVLHTTETGTHSHCIKNWIIRGGPLSFFFMLCSAAAIAAARMMGDAAKKQFNHIMTWIWQRIWRISLATLRIFVVTFWSWMWLQSYESTPLVCLQNDITLDDGQ